MDCNMCGKKDVPLVSVRIEGTVMNVCKGCSQHGAIIQTPLLRNGFGRRNASLERQDFVVDNYATLVRNARSRKGIDQENFARSINEKLSVVSSVESGKHAPSIALAKKMEKFLGITLVDIVSEQDSAPADSSKKESSAPGGFTLGDFIKKKK